jgi:hypothetical protein
MVITLDDGHKSSMGYADLLEVYVDDCLEKLVRIMACEFRDALNLGTDEL